MGIVPLNLNEKIVLIDSSSSKMRFISTEDIILEFIDGLFEMYKISEKTIICVTKNADVDTDAKLYDEEIDYRTHIKRVVKKRVTLAPVRLEIRNKISIDFFKSLYKRFDISKDQVFFSNTPLDISFAFSLEKVLSYPLKRRFLYVPFTTKEIGSEALSFKSIKQKDVLLFYPYDSMQPFLNLVKHSAYDKSVLSIKITLYRLAKQSKLAEYLIMAAENGKDVTIVMELRARFDEFNNIEWAQRFEEAGCRLFTDKRGIRFTPKFV